MLQFRRLISCFAACGVIIGVAPAIFCGAACGRRPATAAAHGNESVSAVEKAEHIVSPTTPEEEPYAVLDTSPVGTWLHVSPLREVPKNRSEQVWLLLHPDGRFERIRGLLDSGQAAVMGNGRYVITGSADSSEEDTESGGVLRFETEAGGSRVEKKRFQVRGRALLLEERNVIGEGQHWETYYRRDILTNTIRVASGTTNVLSMLSTLLAMNGTVAMEMKEIRGILSTERFNQWTLDLAVTSRLPFDAGLGDSLIVAQVADDGLPCGTIRVRGRDAVWSHGPVVKYPNASYLLDDFDSTDGGRSLVIDGTEFLIPCDGEHPPDAGYGFLRRRSDYRFYEILAPSRWLKPESVSGVLAVLPVLVVKTPDGEQRFGAIVSFAKETEGSRQSVWRSRGMDIVPIEPTALIDVLTSPDTTAFRKILAVNWLVMADPEGAGRRLSELLAGKTQGAALAAALRCAIPLRLAGFEEQAMALEDGDAAPIGIRRLATEYLDAMQLDRGFQVLRCDTNDVISRDASREHRVSAQEWSAVRFLAPTSMVVRRILVNLGGPASNARVTVRDESGGFPGQVLAAFEGGGDTRGSVRLQGGTAYWFVVSRDNAEPRMACWWQPGRADAVFTGYADSYNGGATWMMGGTDQTLDTEVWFKHP